VKLRLFVAGLLLANLLFLGWVRGWLGPAWPPPRHAEREPERLAAQVRPAAVIVLAPTAASAAVRAARVATVACLEAGPFGAADIAAAEAALASAQLPEGSWAREPVVVPQTWLVYAGRYPDATLRGVRERDLRRLGLAFEMLDAPAELAPGFVLSRHASREAADAALAATANTALRGARVALLPAPPPLHGLRLARIDGEQAERLRALPAGAFGAGFRPCAAKP
jgi:hypothetical protein